MTSLTKWLGIKVSAEQDDPPEKRLKKWKPEYESNRNNSVSASLVKKWEFHYKWLQVSWTGSNHQPTNFQCKYCKKAGKENSLTKGKLICFLAFSRQFLITLTFLLQKMQ